MGTQRSKSYPNINVIEAVKRIESLKQRSGWSERYDSATFALGIGYKDDKSGAFARTAAALIQYGLVSREGGSFRLTQLSKKILIPELEGDRESATRQAAVTPSLFTTLYNDFKGQELPSLFSNILVNKYGILDGAKNKAAAIFRSSLESVGLVEGNRVLDVDNDQNPVGPSSQSSDPSVDVPIEENVKTPSSGVPSTTLTKDFGEGRVVSVTLPNDITDEERKKLTILIENM